MPKLTPYMLAVTLLSLSTLTSCRKVYDYIRDHPDAHDTLCRVTQIVARGAYGHADTFIITYNHKGNPVTMLEKTPTTASGTTEQYFRYDRFDRLTDHMYTYPSAFGAVAWEKFSYPRYNFVTDTIMMYVGNVRGPAPDAATAFSYSIKGFSMDVHGRIEKAWLIPNDPHQPPQLTDVFTYDANGNRPVPDTLTYDDKINPYRTNKVWQFVNNDYSRNNAVLKGLFDPRPTYNEFGLPVTLPNLQAGPLYMQYFQVENTAPVMTLTYACTIPKGPVNY